MSRLDSKNNLARTDLALAISVVAVALLLVGLIILRSETAHSVPVQLCPIDGMAAEWRTDQRGRNICNYGHFSKVEQKPHTWWAVCQ
jgi:hypothetical protein